MQIKAMKRPKTKNKRWSCHLNTFEAVDHWPERRRSKLFEYTTSSRVVSEAVAEKTSPKTVTNSGLKFFFSLIAFCRRMQHHRHYKDFGSQQQFVTAKDFGIDLTSETIANQNSIKVIISWLCLNSFGLTRELDSKRPSLITLRNAFLYKTLNLPCN